MLSIPKLCQYISSYACVCVSSGSCNIALKQICCHRYWYVYRAVCNRKGGNHCCDWKICGCMRSSSLLPSVVWSANTCRRTNRLPILSSHHRHACSVLVKPCKDASLLHSSIGSGRRCRFCMIYEANEEHQLGLVSGFPLQLLTEVVSGKIVHAFRSV